MDGMGEVYIFPSFSFVSPRADQLESSEPRLVITRELSGEPSSPTLSAVQIGRERSVDPIPVSLKRAGPFPLLI